MVGGGAGVPRGPPGGGGPVALLSLRRPVPTAGEGRGNGRRTTPPLRSGCHVTLNDLQCHTSETEECDDVADMVMAHIITTRVCAHSGFIFHSPLPHMHRPQTRLWPKKNSGTDTFTPSFQPQYLTPIQTDVLQMWLKLIPSPPPPGKAPSHTFPPRSWGGHWPAR